MVKSVFKLQNKWPLVFVTFYVEGVSLKVVRVTNRAHLFQGKEFRNNITVCHKITVIYQYYEQVSMLL